MHSAPYCLSYLPSLTLRAEEKNTPKLRLLSKHWLSKENDDAQKDPTCFLTLVYETHLSLFYLLMMKIITCSLNMSDITLIKGNFQDLSLDGISDVPS